MQCKALSLNSLFQTQFTKDLEFITTACALRKAPPSPAVSNRVFTNLQAVRQKVRFEPRRSTNINEALNDMDPM